MSHKPKPSVYRLCREAPSIEQVRQATRSGAAGLLMSETTSPAQIRVYGLRTLNVPALLPTKTA